MGNTVQGGLMATREPVLRAGAWGPSAAPARGQGSPVFAQSWAGPRALYAAHVCSGHIPAPPGTSKREKQYQAHPAFGDRRDGVISARTYFYANEAKCDSHMETFLACIEAAGGAPLSAGWTPAREG